MTRIIGRGLLTILISVMLVSGCTQQREEQTVAEERRTEAIDAPPRETSALEETANEATASITNSAITITPTTLPPGDLVIYATNNGDVAHALAIEGEEVNAGTTVLNPRETQTLRVSSVPAGTYRVFDPIANYAQEGLQTTITVQEQGTATPTNEGAGDTTITPQ